MAAIAKRTSPPPSMCSSNPPQSKQTAGYAGEARAEFDQVYLKTDGLYWKATGAAANAAARVRGQVRFAADVGMEVTILKGCRAEYCGTAQTPGIDVYLSGTTAGGIDTVASTGGVNPVGFILEDGLRIEFFEPR
jgi:hypothetical protein